MILERVEVGEVQIDDFLFHGAGRVTGLGRFRRRGRGLLLGWFRGSALARGGPLAPAGGLGGLAGRGLGSAALARFLFPSLRRGPVCLGRAATAGLFGFFLGPLPLLLGVLGNGASSALLRGNLPRDGGLRPGLARLRPHVLQVDHLAGGGGAAVHAGDYRLFRLLRRGRAARCFRCGVGLGFVCHACKYLLVSILAAYPGGQGSGFFRRIQKHRLLSR